MSSVQQRYESLFRTLWVVVVVVCSVVCLRVCACVCVFRNRSLASQDRWNQWVCSVAARTFWWNVVMFEVHQAKFARDWVGAVDSACWKSRPSWRRALSPCQGMSKSFRQSLAVRLGFGDRGNLKGGCRRRQAREECNDEKGLLAFLVSLRARRSA